jgi:hypothetical protein
MRQTNLLLPMSFNYIWGKTLRAGDANVFGIHRNPNIILCLVATIERYIANAIAIELSWKRLLHPMGASVTLASHDTSQVTADWTDINQLTRVVCVYPVP